jgi:alkylation response protein AidB-like acyl-CoA dehydrogenase
LYAAAAELGWLGMAIPETYGGIGLTDVEVAQAYEELGRGLVPGPLFGSTVLAARIIEGGGDPDQRSDLLPRLADGDLRPVLAGMDGGRGWGPDLVGATLSRVGSGLVLNGRKRFVQDSGGATHFLCLARLDGGREHDLSIVLVPRDAPGVTVALHSGLMLTGIGDVDLRGVALGADSLIGSVGSGWEVLGGAILRSIPILCSFAVGACADVFDFALQYTAERHAFGQAIGRFQRVQDHMVELANHADAAREVTKYALASRRDGALNPGAVHEAKAVAAESYYQVCNFAHMIHAGPGTDLDHPLMAHTVLSRQLYQYLGSPLDHKRNMMDAWFPRPSSRA